MSSNDWKGKLVDRYRRLFTFIDEDGRERISGYPSVEDGWRDLIELLLERIDKLMLADPAGSLHIQQIKEKFGSLRFYYHAENFTKASTNVIRLAVDLAEARSACTCEICGVEGDLHNKDGYFTTRCAAHAIGKHMLAPPGQENLHVYRSFVSKDRTIAYRRYDRASDSFIEVDPSAVPGLEDDKEE